MRIGIFDFLSAAAAEEADRLAFPPLPVDSLVAAMAAPFESTTSAPAPAPAARPVMAAASQPMLAQPSTAAAPPPVNQLIDGIRQDLPGLIAAAVVDIETGMSLASYSRNAAFEPDTAAAYHAEVLKQQRHAMHALQLHTEQADELLVSLQGELHLLQMAPDQLQFLYVAVDLREANLAIARDVARRYAARIR